MQKINELLIIAAFAYWFAVWSGIPTYVKNVLFKFGVKKSLGYSKTVGTSDPSTKVYIPIRLLPFDCEKCLAFWLSLINFWDAGLIENVMLSGCCSLIAIVLTLSINKLR